MARSQVRLDSKGIAAELKSLGLQRAVRIKAEQVARNVNAQGLVAESGAGDSGPEIRATVEVDITDRARAVVAIKHPAAEAMQAKHGVLTKAAAQAGLEVKS